MSGNLQRFGRFSLVGFMGALLQLILISILSKRLGGVRVATLIAVEITILHNFIWHERFTWKDRATKSSRERLGRIARFHFGNGFTSLAGNTLLMYWVVERLNRPPLPTAIAGIALCSMANFWLADRWVMIRAGEPGPISKPLY